MKVLIVNGSPHPKGNTTIALREVQKTLEENGIGTSWIDIGNQAIQDQKDRSGLPEKEPGISTNYIR